MTEENVTVVDGEEVVLEPGDPGYVDPNEPTVLDPELPVARVGEGEVPPQDLRLQNEPGQSESEAIIAARGTVVESTSPMDIVPNTPQIRPFPVETGVVMASTAAASDDDEPPADEGDDPPEDA